MKRARLFIAVSSAILIAFLYFQYSSAASVRVTELDAAQAIPDVCVASPSGMVGWYPGDGNARDLSGGNNFGSVGVTTGFASGKVGQTGGSPWST